MPIQSQVPIFIQIKEKLKDDILSGVYQQDELILSTNQIAKLFHVNPATAVKSVSLLQEEGIVYKKRGIGMCVTEQAKETIFKERQKDFYESTIRHTVEEAKKLNIDKNGLLTIIKELKEYD